MPSAFLPPALLPLTVGASSARRCFRIDTLNPRDVKPWGGLSRAPTSGNAGAPAARGRTRSGGFLLVDAWIPAHAPHWRATVAACRSGDRRFQRPTPTQTRTRSSHDPYPRFPIATTHRTISRAATHGSSCTSGPQQSRTPSSFSSSAKRNVYAGDTPQAPRGAQSSGCSPSSCDGHSSGASQPFATAPRQNRSPDQPSASWWATCSQFDSRAHTRRSSSRSVFRIRVGASPNARSKAASTSGSAAKAKRTWAQLTTSASTSATQSVMCVIRAIMVPEP